ncbi:MAG TPA: hypothetical protein VIB07_03545 [Nitrososphaera sp.]
MCKSQALESNSFTASDGYRDIHHTCKSCGVHFNHLDGETYATCETCHFPRK